MKHDIQKVWHLKQELTGPLVNYLEPFANRLVEQGYCRRYIGPKIRVIAKFSKWLHVKRISTSDVTQEHAQQFFQGTNHQIASKRGEIAALRNVHEITSSTI